MMHSKEKEFYENQIDELKQSTRTLTERLKEREIVASDLEGENQKLVDKFSSLEREISSQKKSVAQDEKSCVVFGMPKEAIECGGVDHVEDVEKIPEKILEYA